MEKKFLYYEGDISIHLHDDCSRHSATRHRTACSRTGREESGNRNMEVGNRRYLSFVWAIVRSGQVYCHRSMPRICILWSERSIYQIPKHSGHREAKNSRLQGEIGIPEGCWRDRWHPYADKSSTDKPRRLFQPEALLQLRCSRDRRCIGRVFVFVDRLPRQYAWCACFAA